MVVISEYAPPFAYCTRLYAGDLKSPSSFLEVQMGPHKTVRIGGLLRCCIATVEASEIKKAPKEGDILKCRYCSDQMVWKDGAWEWDRPKKGD